MLSTLTVFAAIFIIHHTLVHALLESQVLYSNWSDPSVQFVSFTNTIVLQLGSHYGWSTNLKCTNPSIPLTCTVAARTFTDILVFPVIPFTFQNISDNMEIVLNTTQQIVVELNFDISISSSSVYLSRLLYQYNSTLSPPIFQTNSFTEVSNSFTSAASSPFQMTQTNTIVNAKVIFTIVANYSNVITTTTPSNGAFQSNQMFIRPMIQFLNYGNSASTISISCMNISVSTQVYTERIQTQSSSSGTPITTTTITTTTTIIPSDSNTTNGVNTETTTTNTYQSSSSDVFTNGDVLQESGDDEQLSLTQIIGVVCGTIGLIAVCMIVVMVPIFKMRHNQQKRQQASTLKSSKSHLSLPVATTEYTYDLDKEEKMQHQQIPEVDYEEMTAMSSSLSQVHIPVEKGMEQDNYNSQYHAVCMASTIDILGPLCENSEHAVMWGIVKETRCSVTLCLITLREYEKIEKKRLARLLSMPGQENVLELKGIYLQLEQAIPRRYLVTENVEYAPFHSWWNVPRNFISTLLVHRLYYAICITKAMEYLHDNDVILFRFNMNSVFYTNVNKSPFVLKLSPVVYIDAEGHYTASSKRDTEYLRQCGPPELRKIKECTKEIDVWYLGLLLWHFFDSSEHPFGEGIPLQDVSDLVSSRRLKPVKPRFAPTEVFKILEDCWKLEPSNRCTTRTLEMKLTLFYNQLTEEDPQDTYDNEEEIVEDFRDRNFDEDEKEKEKEKKKIDLPPIPLATIGNSNNSHQYVSFDASSFRMLTPTKASAPLLDSEHVYCNIPSLEKLSKQLEE